jgi:hypothetical protein
MQPLTGALPLRGNLVRRDPAMNRKQTPSFTTFLDVVQGRRPADDAGAEGSDLLRLLRVLATNGPADMNHLWKLTEMDLPEFAQALKLGQDTDLISVATGDEGEIYDLTDKGKAVTAPSS